MSDLYYRTVGNKTIISGEAGNALGYIRPEMTSAGPRYFALRADGAYATPAEGREAHAEAVEDFLRAVRAGLIQ